MRSAPSRTVVEVDELVRRADRAGVDDDARELLAAHNASDAGALVTEEDRMAADLKVRESMTAMRTRVERLLNHPTPDTF